MQVSVLLAVFIAFLVTGIVQEHAGEDLFWLGQWQPIQVVCLLVGSILIFGGVSRFISNLLLKRLERLGWKNRAAMRLPAKIDLIIQFLLIMLYLAQLTVGGWCKLVFQQWDLGRYILVWEILLLLPFFCLVIFKWLTFYDINYFIRSHVVSDQLAGGISTRPVWTRKEYLIFQIRNSLLIMIMPLLFIFAARDILDWGMPQWFPNVDNLGQLKEIISSCVVGIIFLLSPLILRMVWSTRTFPDGPLRERLEKFCKGLKLKYQNILLWNTYSAVANAAVMGMIWPVRYVLLSDALVENMDDDEIEAVFGHEAGHVKYNHILFLLLFVIGFGSLAFLLLEGFLMLLAKMSDSFSFINLYSDWISGGFSLLILAGWLTLFGWVSRRFEWQADAYAALSVTPDPEDGSIKAIDQHPEILHLDGARIMKSALQRVALLNGISVYSRSWRHSSIANRIDLLAKFASQPGQLKKFMNQVTMIKIVIFVVLISSITGWWGLAKLQ